MFRYGLYARKSHDDPKVTAKSTGEQVSECLLLATPDSLRIVRTWEESRSAKTPNKREGYAEMIRLVEKGKIDGILCWHVNRLVRNMEEGGKLVQLLIDGKIREIRTPHATYRAGENIMAIVIEAASATQHSIDLRNTVKRSMDGNFRSGGWNHKAPHGYRNSRTPENLRRGSVEPDGPRFRLIRKFWDLILTESCGVAEALRTLNVEWGYRSRATSNRPALPMTPSGAYGLLRNPFYAGFVREGAEIVRGRHRAMVQVEEFQLVQRILDKNAVRAHKRHEHAYTGLLRCAYCGQMVTAELKRLRNGSMWETYRCSDSWRVCTKRGMSVDRLEREIVRALEQLQVDPELLEIARMDVVASISGQATAYGDLLSQQEETTRAAKDRLDRIDEMWVSGLLTDRARYRELQLKERNAISTASFALERARNEASLMRTNAERASRFLANAREAFASNQFTSKRAIIAALATRLTFYGIEKRIDIDVHPLLSQMVRHATSLKPPFEPPVSGFRSTIKPPLAKAVLSGRPNSDGIEPIRNQESKDGCPEAPGLPQSLLDALMGDLFPDVDYGPFAAMEEAPA